MPVSSRTPQRRRRSRKAAVTAGGLLLALAGCSGESAPERPAVRPTTQPTPLADYATSELGIVPGEFCDRVSEEATEAALGSEASGREAWQPGTRLPGSRDISNEFGCSWSTTSATARAWVFAPPVTRERAADFVEETVDTLCRRLADATTLGDPGVAQRCGLDTGATLTGLYGLVGDAWVGCEISGLPESGGGATARVGEWCVAVLEALRTS